MCVSVCACFQNAAASTACATTVQAVAACVRGDPVWRVSQGTTVTRRPRLATLTDCTNTVTSTRTAHTTDCVPCKMSEHPSQPEER